MLSTRLMLLAAAVAGVACVVDGVAQDARETKWDHSLSVGVNLSDGNSKTLMSSAGYIGERKGGPNELKFTAGGNYGETEVAQPDGTMDTETNVQNFNGAAVYRRLLDEMNYVAAHVDGSQDKIADVTYRLIAGPAVGRYLMKDDADNLKVEAGVDYISDKVAGEESDRAAIRLEEQYTHKFAQAKVWESVSYLPKIDDMAVYLLNAEVGAEAAMTEGMSLRVVLQDKYNSDPAPGKKNNDVLVTAGVLWKI